MMGDDLVGNEDIPTMSRSTGGSNSLDLSLRAIERFCAELREDGGSVAAPVKIMVEVVDETTSRVVVHPSTFFLKEFKQWIDLLLSIWIKWKP